MTLPSERTNAIILTKMFLRELLDAKLTPKVPRAVRLRALACLRHYPNVFELSNFKKNFKPLTRKEVDAIEEFFSHRTSRSTRKSR